MEHTRFVGLDIHKERISIAVAESGRSCACLCRRSEQAGQILCQRPLSAIMRVERLPIVSKRLRAAIIEHAAATRIQSWRG
jgi:hypothetical protein